MARDTEKLANELLDESGLGGISERDLANELEAQRETKRESPIMRDDDSLDAADVSAATDRLGVSVGSGSRLEETARDLLD